MAQLDVQTEQQLRARVAELEALLEARTHTIVSLAATVAELQGTGASTAIGKLRDAERQIEALHNTKLYRYAAVPRRWYATLRETLVGR